MLFLIVILTVAMVLDCAALVFLVLIQLPKKEAGTGLAFGGAATDALFGAGSGNVLTKITKYAATIFFVMAIVLSVLQNKFHTRTTSQFRQQLEQAGTPALPMPTPSAPAPAPKPATPLMSSTNLLSAPAPEASTPPATATNSNPAAPK